MTLREFREKTIQSLPMLLGLSLACPGAAHAASKTCDAYNVSDLNACFTAAEQNPFNSYTVYLRTKGTYVLTKTLTLAVGTVYLRTAPNTLATADQYVLDAGYPGSQVGWKQAIKVAKGPANYTPYLSISGITVKGGLADQAAGGGVYVKDGTVIVQNSYIRDNASTSLGSGLYVEGTGYASVFNSIVRDNKNLYAAPANPQQVLCGGLMAGGGGMAVNLGGFLSVDRSTVMGNQSCRGGGIAAYSTSSLSVMNSTITGNKANLTGGGIFLYGSVSTTLAFNTISENKAGFVPTGGSGYFDEKYGGGIGMMGWQGSAYLYGNIIAKNQTVNSNKKTLYYDGHDCFDRFTTDALHNRYVAFDDNFIGALANCTGILAQSDGWWFAGSEGNPADPLLNALSQKTGTAGPQYTYAPKSTSPTIGNYWSTDLRCQYADQLGHRRDYYEHDMGSPTRCDMGAHQYNWYH